MKIIISKHKVHEIEQIPKQFFKNFQKNSEELLNSLKLITPVKTGALRNSINITFSFAPHQYRAHVRAKRYFLFLDQGTTGHFIKPKKHKGVLHWLDGNSDRFSRGHGVSGIPKMDLVKRALDMVKAGWKL